VEKRKYTVSGEDEFGDIQAFHTDDEERARGMEAEFKEDLQNVKLTAA
jgi:hypothetical protein